MNPKILILDEPAAGLDPAGRRDILGGIKKYSRESGTTVIIVSHSMEDMALYCDSIIVMSDSKILMHKPVSYTHLAAEESFVLIPAFQHEIGERSRGGFSVDSGDCVNTAGFEREEKLHLGGEHCSAAYGFAELRYCLLYTSRCV